MKKLYLIIDGPYKNLILQKESIGYSVFKHSKHIKVNSVYHILSNTRIDSIIPAPSYCYCYYKFDGLDCQININQKTYTPTNVYFDLLNVNQKPLTLMCFFVNYFQGYDLQNIHMYIKFLTNEQNYNQIMNKIKTTRIFFKPLIDYVNYINSSNVKITITTYCD